MILMRKDGSVIFLSGKGTPLGVLPGYSSKYIGGEVPIQDNDLIVLYTDGVIEATDKDNNEFGLDAFIEILKGNIHKKPEEIIDEVYRRVMEFSGSELQYDDFTILISRFHGTIRGMKDYRFTLPAQVESIPALRDFILNICQRHGLSGREVDDILLAADEAATNIILHAYDKTDITDPFFECELYIESNKLLRIVLIDKGRVFDPQNVKEPNLNENLTGKRKGGFGVYLIKSIMDSVEYQRVDDKNYLRMERNLQHY
jgi:phosphoserine phosphatase RsbU/P